MLTPQPPKMILRIAQTWQAAQRMQPLQSPKTIFEQPSIPSAQKYSRR